MQSDSPDRIVATGRGRPWSGSLVGRAVRSRAVRTIMAVAGVAISTLLVLVLAAVYRSVTAGVESYVGQRRVDLWVAPLGSDNLIRSSGMMPLTMASMLGAVDGVKTADPMLRGFVSATAKARLRPLTLLAVGYRGPDGLGAPPSLPAGGDRRAGTRRPLTGPRRTGSASGSGTASSSTAGLSPSSG
jgi:hypothetical protein